MPVQRLKKFLDEEGVQYVTISHSTAYTAQGIARQIHLSGNTIAKTVMVKVDGKMAMAVLPGPYKIDVAHLKQVLRAKTVEIATEEEFKGAFPDCEIGAMPPFGNLYDMAVYVDEILTKEERIVFNAGSHRELIQLAYKDFRRLVKPKIINFSFVTL